MSQNRSSAVMQQRSEPHDSLDDFPTPPWATRALCEWMNDNHLTCNRDIIREPAANRGFMAKVLEEYFDEVIASDIFDYGAGYEQKDYLFGPERHVDWTITNPPFRLAGQFIEKALEHSRLGVAMIVRSAFLEGVGRHERLFSKHPPQFVLQFSERVPMYRGRYNPTGSTATSYAWIIWCEDLESTTELHWIAPCRKRLELASDADLFGGDA